MFIAGTKYSRCSLLIVHCEIKERPKNLPFFQFWQNYNDSIIAASTRRLLTLTSLTSLKEQNLLLCLAGHFQSITTEVPHQMILDLTFILAIRFVAFLKSEYEIEQESYSTLAYPWTSEDQDTDDH